MFLPTHSIYVIDANGHRENIMMTDCATKQEVRAEVKSYIQMLIKNNKTSYEDWTSIEYVDRNEKVLYACSIEECMED